MRNKVKKISINVILKPPIKVYFGEYDNSIYSYKQTLKELIEEESPFLFIEDKFFLYYKEDDGWYRERIND